jgi:6-pyruvoyltetrahydropterin/6-carboxytetrahydropterin synthase
MYKIVKKFKNYPFAHRQHNHSGHCRKVHGHNWDFEVCVEAKTLDKNGFVYDFGKFKALRKWFEQKFDHTCLINEDDPKVEIFKMLQSESLLNLVLVKSGSAEGLAKMIYKKTDTMLQSQATVRQRGLSLVYIHVREDKNNSALFMGD